MTKIKITYNHDPRTNPAAPFFAYGRGKVNEQDSLYSANSPRSFAEAKILLVAKIRADQASAKPAIPPDEEIDV